MEGADDISDNEVVSKNEDSSVDEPEVDDDYAHQGTEFSPQNFS